MHLRENHHPLQDSTTVRPENRNERRPQVVIAVMGVTGSGKSTFIRNTTGRNDIFVGHGLNSGKCSHTLLR